MGTRNLTCVVVGGEFKVAQYGQWDGYPSGQGLTALEFLHVMDRNKFLQALSNTYQPTEEQINKWWNDVGVNLSECDGWVTVSESHKFKSSHPSLSRDIGADILVMIEDSQESIPLVLSNNFAANSLLCKWAYVIDFDKNTFEVYEGYNKESLAKSERFYGYKVDESNGYEPVKLVKAYSLDYLPSQEDFLAELENEEE